MRPKYVQASQGQKEKKRGGSLFIFIVFFVLSFIYIGYTGIVLRSWFIPYRSGSFTIAVTFHIFFILFILSFIKCASTDPGKVPRNWGFYVGDDVKRRRYCKICNVWKPDRTHHCSACNRCVLNMDHHCPWINNCVGFFNRRFFIQLLFYGLVCLFIIAVQTFHYIFIDNINAYFDDGFQEKSSFVALEYTYASIVLFLTFVLIFALVPFTKFHLKLISKNSTTIENMDMYSQEYNIYNVGCEDNAKQVFGNNILCWLCPFQCVSNRPAGDGVRWRVSVAHENPV
ncbi:DHHC zinc finger multi-pass transmembrane protein [Plasmodium falciparum IGH-CR14]|uniref:Palmitoyltransferase n=5 Tax=Plasmodium falciparum TaxID=5833 RepID=C6KSU5_PLAF7|nr:palmitoyltransferase DHHC2, putative [Plasmodium falciparum 3D7]KAF4327489.1 palmitoyltransferase DHHC2 [Plasmodium falciparum NF54]KNG75347.1 DHHC zinc finger multi-pass transmembrane protein [Plasmodium falciparum IGH-CR14]SOS77362.1 palmitoyltransferase, putative [Plasmodium sp. gorilla clade G1]PKC43069.1 palmitoyltransferase DHHC2 [Plasmodium falciparum NF54]CAG25340.1 palmitoyltransferase DHHC2, putative [Plasmodium falciparum 3D7]|eukprot:XP_966088.1 palmitoyltransferase, putative [Plasmodium falciparum 3D7]